MWDTKKNNRKSLVTLKNGVRVIHANSFSEKRKTNFKKLEYGFLVQSITIENATFPHRTALAKTNVKTTRMESAKRTYHKEWSFATNYHTFENSISVYKKLL